MEDGFHEEVKFNKHEETKRIMHEEVKCTKHNVTPLYECLTCNKVLCGDCFREHKKEEKKHDIISYAKEAEKIMEEADKLYDKLNANPAKVYGQSDMEELFNNFLKKLKVAIKELKKKLLVASDIFKRDCIEETKLNKKRKEAEKERALSIIRRMKELEGDQKFREISNLKKSLKAIAVAEDAKEDYNSLRKQNETIVNFKKNLEIIEKDFLNHIEIIQNKLKVRFVLYIQLEDNSKSPYEVDMDMKINELTELIIAKEGWETKNCLLYFNNELLDKNTNLSKCNVKEGSIISAKKGMLLFIKTITGKAFTINVSGEMKMSEVKKIIYEKRKIKLSEQRLLFEGEAMYDDNKTLNENEVRNESTIFIVLVQSDAQQILVKEITGKTHMFDISSEEKVIDLKMTIQKDLGYEVEKQRLIKKNRDALDDHKTFSELGIENGCTIYLILIA